MKRGPKPRGKISTTWSVRLAYAIGLLTADGCLSKDRRHINLTSKDKEQIILFKKCLGLKTKIGEKYSGNGNLTYQTQFGDVLFYKFLEDIGLSSAKSKTIRSVTIPEKYFFDFLRGYFDGDGCSYSYYDRKYKKSYRFYISFASASTKYLEWLRERLSKLAEIRGHMSYGKKPSHVQLKYSKKEAMIISKKMYYSSNLPRLKRKYLKISKSLSIIQ